MELRPNALPSSNLIASRKRKLGTVRRPRKMLTQSDPNQRTRLHSLSRGSPNDCRAGQCLQACLEGIVSKKLDAPNRSGPSRTWIKVKVRRHLRPREQLTDCFE